METKQLIKELELISRSLMRDKEFYKSGRINLAIDTINEVLPQADAMLSLPTGVIELLKRAKTFAPLYMPTEAHNEHNQLGLDLIKCFEKYGIEWRQ